MAKFIGIGVGPGDPDLMTVKAIKAIQNVDIIYTPLAKDGAKSLAQTIAEQYVPATVQIKERHFPMVFDQETKLVAWKKIAKEITYDVKAGNDVGFLTLGDAMIYATYVYILQLVKGDVEVETIPGISSFSNIASSNTFPLVMDTESLIVVPAVISLDKIEKYIKEFKSIVLMKVFKQFDDIKALIKKYDLLDHAILVCSSSLSEEEVYYPITDCTNESISYFSTILINKNWSHDE